MLLSIGAPQSFCFFMRCCRQVLFARNPQMLTSRGVENKTAMTRAAQIARRPRSWQLAFAAFCLLSLTTGKPAFAQVTSSLIGTVRDQTGGAIAGAHVTALETNTNSSRSTTTDDLGEYRIDFLPVGNYELSVSAAGFKQFVRKGIILQLQVSAQVDASLELGSRLETISVAADVPLTNTSGTEIGRTIENQEIVNMPLINRNAYQLLELTPGVQNSSFNPGQPTPANTLGYPEQRTFIDGGVDGGAGSVSYYLDGGINMTGLRNTGNILPNPDAIQEYRVQTNNYDAEYGKMSSGVIAVITKSGTNQYHGLLSEYLRNDVLNANNWGSILAKPELRRNQYGGTLSGPIKKDKSFFFASYQGLRQLSSFFMSGGTVPTPAQRTGDLTGLAAALPSQYTCGSATVICPSLLDPVAQKLLNPSNSTTNFPTIPAANIGATGWQGTVTSSFNSDEFLVKLDHYLTKNHRLSGSYFYTSGNSTVPPLNSSSGQPNGNIPWSVQRFSWRQQNLNLNDTLTLGPSLVNQAWFSYTRNFGGRLDLPALSLEDLGAAFTIQGAPSLPQITVQGPVAFTAANAIAGPLAGTNLYSIRDLASYNRGRHAILFGAEEILDKDIQQTLLNNYGVFAFSTTNVTDAVSGKAVSIPGIALFLMGLPTSITQDAPVTAYTNSWTTGLFAQDNFRVRPRLTFNLGLRWDVQTPPTDPLNRGTSFQVGQQSAAIPAAPKGALFYGDPGITRGIVPIRWHHVSPRVGVAWDPVGDGQTSLRAAAGIFYGSVSGNEWNTVTNFEPSAIRFTLTNTSQAVKGSGATAVPQGATLSCPYNFLSPKFVFGVTNIVTCPTGSGMGIGGTTPFPFVPPNFLTAAGPFFGFDRNFQWPYSYQFNLSLQRQITAKLSVSAAYVGALSYDLPFAEDINSPATGALAPACATSNSGNIALRRPIDNPGSSNSTTTRRRVAQRI